MSIKKVFKQHFKLVFNDRGQRECQCGYFIGNGDNAGKLHKKHAIQVLEQHVLEAKAAVLEEAAAELNRLDSDVEMYDENLHATPVETWLRDRANQMRVGSE